MGKLSLVELAAAVVTEEGMQSQPLQRDWEMVIHSMTGLSCLLEVLDWKELAVDGDTATAVAVAADTAL